MNSPNLFRHPTAARVEVEVLALGVYLRVNDYLLRSLWLDEVMLARNIVDRPLGSCSARSTTSRVRRSVPGPPEAHHGRVRVWAATASAAAGCRLARLLWCAVQDARRLVLYPDRGEKTREVLRFVAANAAEGDVLFVHPNARRTFEFYKGRFGLDRHPMLHGNVVPPAVAARQVRDIPGNCRVWVNYRGIPNAAVPIVPKTADEVGAAAASQGRVEHLRRVGPGYGPRCTSRRQSGID